MDLNEKYRDLGHYAKTYLDLHNENPKEFTAERILSGLFSRYEQLGFEPLKEEAK